MRRVLIWAVLILPLLALDTSQCQPKDEHGRPMVMRCTKEGQVCRTARGNGGKCITGGANDCENPPCLICR